MVRGVRIFLMVAIAGFALLGCAYASETFTLSLEEPALENNSGVQAASETSNVPKKKVLKKAAAKTNNVRVGRVGLVKAASTPIYRAQSYTASKYATVGADTPLAIVKEEHGWYGVIMANGAVGWVPGKSVKLTGYDLLAKKSNWNRSNLASRGGQIPRTGSWTDNLIQTALDYSGIRYVFGGTNPNSGMDCSAYVRMVFSQYSIPLPRTAREQAEIGITVPFDQLQPGDRLYFSCKNPYIDHCGIYAGNGQFVHCNSTKNGVSVDSLYSDFFSRSLVIAKRS